MELQGRLGYQELQMKDATGLGLQADISVATCVLCGGLNMFSLMLLTLL